MLDDEKAERSRRYPAAPLREAIALLDAVYRGVGLNGGTRETLARALGHQSLNGTSKRKIATLVQYGLLEKDGERYRVSELGRRLVIPVNEAERAAATAEAVRRPALFQEIGAAYDGDRLPGMLANVLAREFRVLPQASSEVATIFTESVQQAGLLRDEKLYWTSEPPREDGSTSNPVATPAGGSPAPASGDLSVGPMSSPPLQQTGNSLRRVAPPDGLEEYTIALDGRGRRAIVHLPVPVTSRDLSRIMAWVAFMKEVVEEEPLGVSAN